MRSPRRRHAALPVLVAAVLSGCAADPDVPFTAGTNAGTPTTSTLADGAAQGRASQEPVTSAPPTLMPPTATSTSTMPPTASSTPASNPATTTPSTTTTTTTTTVPTTTRCADVAHVGDSTGVYLWDGRYMDGDVNTMGERYRSVGVERWIEDNSGGRSVIERATDWQTNALEVADAIRSSGFSGCWVVMIGTNDAANVAAGASTGYEDRILRMLYVFGDDPVLWLDAATLRSGGSYANRHMEGWNEALDAVASVRPNVSVLPWSDLVRPEWFVDDGIHMTTEGRVWRAAITAAGLVDAFPA